MRWLWCVVALGLSSAAVARPPQGEGGEGMVERLVEQLDLTDAEEEKVRTILGSAREEGVRLREEAKALGAELRLERAAEEPNLKRMEKLVRRLGDLRTEGEILRMRAMYDVMAALPADKAARLKAHLLEHADEGHERGEP